MPPHMQEESFNLVSLLQHAARWHGEQEVVTHAVEGGMHRQGYAQTLARTTRLASALLDWGLAPGDRVGTLAWNTHRHLEAWYAISGQGAICHTINPRLFPEQLRYIIDHAQDRLLFVDLTFVEALGGLLPDLPGVEAVIIMSDRTHMPDTGGWREGVEVHCYEEFLGEGAPEFDWPVLDEHAAAGLCYTSGTTGDPKGVIYTHRSNLLHAWAACGGDAFNIRASDTVLMVVPMFHANSWGLAYAGPQAGARLVLPGPHMDGASLHALIESEGVTRAAAVPTVWNMLIAHLEATGGRLDSMQEVVIGGAAVPRAMIDVFDREYDVEVIHAWGMTETSPIGTINRTKPSIQALPREERLAVRAKQGRPVFGIDLCIVDEAGQTLPRDGKTFGRLLCRGPWVIDHYYRNPESARVDGWFDTGDVATIDEHGYMQITDRAKDVIKSGGEWISSVALENAAMAHPGVAMAACIGATHPKWGERPILLIKPASGAEAPGLEALREFLAADIARWQLPDAVFEIDEIPLTATGKIDKKPLRRKYQGALLEMENELEN